MEWRDGTFFENVAEIDHFLKINTTRLAGIRPRTNYLIDFFP